MITEKMNSEIARLAEAAAFAMFGSAQRLERYRRIAQVAFFISAMVSLFTAGYFLYFAAIIGFAMGAGAFALKLIAQRRKVLAHSLHRVSMLAKAFQLPDDSFDVGYLLSKVPSRIHLAAVEAAKKEDPSGEYALQSEETGAERLRWMIQENAFFNATLFEVCADRVLRLIAAPAALILLFLLLTLPVVGGDIAYVVLRIVMAMLSLAILYDQIERWSSWRAASRLMLDLENELARFRTVPNHRVLLLL
jgi:hypothetical protein